MKEETEIELNVLIEEASEFQVLTLADCERSSELLQRMAEMKKAILDELDPPCQKAHAAWKANVALRDRHIKPIEEKIDLVKREVAKFQDAQRRAQEEALT